MGMAESSEFTDITVEKLMAAADERMYENKKQMKAARTA
jgi:hypothetical protein